MCFLFDVIKKNKKLNSKIVIDNYQRLFNADDFEESVSRRAYEKEMILLRLEKVSTFLGRGIK
jgi:hypothetical protein